MYEILGRGQVLRQFLFHSFTAFNNYMKIIPLTENTSPVPTLFKP
jgi:hypothetical protein